MLNSMTRVLYLGLAIVVGAAGLAFHARNHQAVAFDLFFVRDELELSVVVVGALALGCLLGALAMLSVVLGLKGRLRRAHRQQHVVQRELEALRAATLKDVH